MNRIMLNVRAKKEVSVVSLIKEINNISCRIQINFEKSFVIVENFDDTTIDSILELIDRYFTILKVMIDNFSDELTDEANNSEIVETKQKPKKVAKSSGNEKSAILDIIGESLSKLDSTKNVEEQANVFLTDIGMSTSDGMVTQAFVAACSIKRINYENVIFELHKVFPEVKDDVIKLNLKRSFKEWLGLYPKLVNNFPTISLMSVLKIFAEKFA